MKKFLGSGVALVTPFTDDKEIDLDAIERLVNYQLGNGIDYLVVLGTTGETATLTKEEQQLVKAKVIEVNAGRLPLVIGIGGNNTQALVEELQSSDLSGFSAVLSVSPYYNKPTQEGIYQHYKALSKASPLPIILYNVPSRTGSNMVPETILSLAGDFDNIIGVKEAAGDMEQALEILKNKPEDFMLISGEDKLALALTLAGGAGVISVIGQAFPKEFSKMINLGLEGKSKEAYKLFYKLISGIDLAFEEGNPAGIKSMLRKLNICDDHLRLPLVSASVELEQKINTFVDHFKKQKHYAFR